jgi:hypothetical protein
VAAAITPINSRRFKLIRPFPKKEAVKDVWL